MIDLMLGLSSYFIFYSTERPHQCFEYKSPNKVYTSAFGGGGEHPGSFRRRGAGRGRYARLRSATLHCALLCFGSQHRKSNGTVNSNSQVND